nr:double-strand break repair protein AddB [Sneathiella limimaris]
MNIPPEYPFVDCLARYLLDRYQADLTKLGDITILTTTRRAARALQNAFLRETHGKPLLLPRMRPLGDVDEDELALEGDLSGDQQKALELPPAIESLRRQLLLSRLIATRDPEAYDLSRAAGLAIELSRLLDQVQTEGLELDGLKELVPAEYAEHWQVTLEFLKIISDVWPRILEEEGAIDPARRRDLLLRLQIEEWQTNPPDGEIFAVGSTGSIPTTADMLCLVASLPNGTVVLPGVDKHLDEQSWEIVQKDPSHPQYGLSRLLQKMGVSREDVPDLKLEGLQNCPTDRSAFLSEAMRPASTTDKWQDTHIPAVKDFGGVIQINCSGAQAEAQVIALAMRQSLEDPTKTTALVTPDRDLSRRVVAELKRWGLEVDDSAGSSLDQSPPGIFLRLTARLVAERFDPLVLLSTLKHPYSAMDYPKGTFRQLIRELERKVLRGPRPAEGLSGIQALVKLKQQHGEISDELAAWFEEFCELVRPFSDLMTEPQVDFELLVKSHVRFAEQLSVFAETGDTNLWYGHFGESAAGFISELLRASDIAGQINPESWAELLDSLMVGRMVRSRYGQHPRLQIWGPIEARLQRADRMILGGLNKGIWPPEQAGDPWMSRPMRQDFNLPLPEKKIGLSAHDFQQAFCAKEVILTRAEKLDGAPTVPSRWLLRIETLLRKNGESLSGSEGLNLQDWQNRLDRPVTIAPVDPPRPTPPLFARPRRLSVTRIEKWIKDPYSIFADAILGLKPLDEIGMAPGGAEKGTLIHEALEKFVKCFPDHLPADAEERLLKIGGEVFADVLAYPAVWAFWWPRFERIARWFVEFERERRETFKPTLLEAKGTIDIPAPKGSFTLSGTADRIDENGNGEVSVIDYKTGSVPSDKQVETGISPQLSLEAAMIERGGFTDLKSASVIELLYLRLSGGEPAGEVKHSSKKVPVTELAEAAYEGLSRLIAQFDKEATPYLVRPRPDFVDRFNDYEHLSRLREWSGGQDD